MQSDHAKKISVDGTKKQLVSSSRQTVRTPGDWEGKVFCTADAFDPLTDKELKDLGFD
ncbi:MAG: hypothetical protein WAL52_17170 [Candidatus Sulfotelmatobacter sp.]